MELEVLLRLEEDGKTFPEFFNISGQDAKQIEKTLKTRILLEEPREVLMQMLQDFDGDSSKIIYTIFMFGQLTGLSQAINTVIERGSEKTIQGHLSEHIHLLLNSGAGIAEIRQALDRK